MSALAKLSKSKGAVVSGSDDFPGETVEQLKGDGINITNSVKELEYMPNLLVYTSALKLDAPDIMYAIENGVPIMERHQFLAKISEDFPYIIAVSGTHGKTTVTAVISYIFSLSDKLYTAHIGGNALGLGNCPSTGEDFFITEACEYKRSFLSLRPSLGLVLNMECDHPDCYSCEEEIVSAFRSFGNNSKRVLCLKKDADKLNCEDMQTLSVSHIDNLEFDDKDNCDYYALITEAKSGRYKFDFYQGGKLLFKACPTLFGRHNVTNCAFAAAACLNAGIDVETIKKGIDSFKGVARRNEEFGSMGKMRIVFDYAHHPCEISATLSLARQMADKVLVVFQPHTYSRTASYFKDFVEVLRPYYSILLPTYAARESAECGKTSKELCDAINDSGGRAVYLDDFQSAAEKLKKHKNKFDLAMILGAGDIIDLKKFIKIK